MVAFSGIVAAFLILVASTGLSWADQKDPRLDKLFVELQETDNPQKARLIERSIWSIWVASDSPTLELLMNHVIMRMGNQEYGEALRLLDAIVTISPEYAEGWNKRATVYFRQTFDVDAVELIDRLPFKLLRDDASAVYLNGTEVYRDSNLSRNARHTTFASSTIVDENAYATFEVDGSRLANGKNVVTAEVHQSNRTSSDLSFALFGKAHMLPGAWVTLKVDSSNYTNDLIYLNVKESPFTIVFDSKLQKTYTVEASTNLIDWDETQVINGNGDSVEFNPTPQPGEKARFFRIRLNR